MDEYDFIGVIDELDGIFNDMIADINAFSNEGNDDNINPTAYAYARIMAHLNAVNGYFNNEEDFCIPIDYIKHDIIKNINVELPIQVQELDEWKTRVDVFARDLVNFVIIDAWNSFNKIDDLSGKDVEVAFLSYLNTMYFGIKRT